MFTFRVPSLVTAATLGAALVLGGCGSAGENSSSGDAAGAGGAAVAPATPEAARDAAGVAEPAAGDQVATAENGSAGAAASGGLADAAATADRRIARTAQLVVEVKQLEPAAARIRQLATDLGGFVATETTGYSAAVGTTDADVLTGEQRRQEALAGQSVLVLRIPESSLDQALTRSAGVGTEVGRTSSAQDVTGDLADLTSRTATARASVARVRELLAQAKNLNEIVLLESELTRRESDLEALQARLAALSDRADLATLTVTLQTPEASPPSENGFLRGLRRGLDALQASTEALVVLVGGLLPFALVLAVIGLPLWRLLRHRRSRPAAPTAQAPSTSGDPVGTPAP